MTLSGIVVMQNTMSVRMIICIESNGYVICRSISRATLIYVRTGP